MSWYITGTGPHFWDSKFSELFPQEKVISPDITPPFFYFSTVGPFWTLPEAKKWVYLKRILWIDDVTHKLHQSEDIHYKAKKNLGYYSVKVALQHLQDNNPEIKI